jgi:sulfhydrogenase subunit beta (sulfur reductase)
VKHRFNRKGRYILERYGMQGCVGCGRCARSCLVDINPIEVFNQLKGQPVERQVIR